MSAAHLPLSASLTVEPGYEQGQEYHAHSDFIDHPADPSGPRILTFFLFLNSLPADAGGSTWFPSAPSGTGVADEWSRMDWSQRKQLGGLQQYYKVCLTPPAVLVSVG